MTPQEREALVLPLRTGARNALANAGITALGQLTALTRLEVLRIKGLGRTGLVSIVRALEAQGLSLQADAVGEGWSGVCGVYFIQCGAFVKIGQGGNLRKRIKYIETHTPYEVRLLGVVPCFRDQCRREELALHLRFQHLHHRLEWFHLTPEITAFIDTLAPVTL